MKTIGSGGLIETTGGQEFLKRIQEEKILKRS